MPARVRNAGDERGELKTGLLRHAKCVDIGAKRDSLACIRADVNVAAGAGETHCFQSVFCKHAHDEVGGFHLFVGQLRVRVQVSTPADHALLVLRKPRVNARGDRHCIRL